MAKNNEFIPMEGHLLILPSDASLRLDLERSAKTILDDRVDGCIMIKMKGF